MSLESFFEQTNDDHTIAKIRQRRAQMLIHSCIYYEMDDNQFLAFMENEKPQMLIKFNKITPKKLKK